MPRLVRYSAAFAFTAALGIQLLWLLYAVGVSTPDPGGLNFISAAMIVCGSVSVLLVTPSDRWANLLSTALALAMVLGGGYSLAGPQPHGRLLEAPGAMAWSFTLLGFALLLTKSSVRNLQAAAWITTSIGALVPIHLLYTFVVGLVSVSTKAPITAGDVAIALLTLLLISAILYLNPSWRSLNYFASRGPEGRIIRRLIPITLSVPLVLAMLVARGYQQATFDSAVTLGLLATTLAVVTSIAVWMFSIYLAQVDSARRTALAELQESRDTLEERVRTATAGLASANRALLAQVQATREAQSEFESLFFSAPDAILVVRPNGEIQMANERACVLFGYSRSQLVELRIEDLMPAGYRTSHVLLRENYLLDPVARMMNPNRPVRALRRDGTEILLEINLSPLGRVTRPDIIAVIRDVSDLERTKESLALSESRFRETLQHAPIGMAILNLDFNWIEVNNAFCTILGRSREEVMSSSFADLTHPDDLHTDRPLIAQLLNKQISSYQIERRYLRKDGAIVWGLVRVTLVRNDRGEPQQYITQVVDISPLKATQQALIDSRSRLQRVLEGANDGVWDWNLVVGEMDLSERFYRIMGYPPGEPRFTYESLSALTHPDDFAVAEERLEEHLTGHSDFYEAEYRARHRNGSWVWLLARGKVYERDVNGKPLRMAGTISDVTVRHRMESAVRERERILRAVLEAMPTSVLIADSRGTITASNPAAIELWRGAQYVGIDGFGVYRGWWVDSGKPIAPHDWALARAIEKRETSRDELIEIETFDGSRKTILNFATPIADEKGHLEGAIGVSQDITQILQLEKDLVRRTRELEESNKELEQFAYAASHDLQEPLRKITSFVQLFARRYSDKVDTTAQEYIEIIVEGAQRMKTLIDDLLRYSRVTGGERVFSVVDTADIVRGVLKDLELQLNENQVRIHVDGLPRVVGDPSQIRALFQNLISNAIKFRAPQDPILEIRCTEEDGHYAFSVRDNGIGIDPKYFERIFVLFQRLHTRTEYPGTGIGLAICKKIVERHGGRIWVESSVGQGSTFHFTLPVPTEDNAGNGPGGALR